MAVAALLGDSSPAHALRVGASNFVTVVFNRLDPSVFVYTAETFDPQPCRSSARAHRWPHGRRKCAQNLSPAECSSSSSCEPSDSARGSASLMEEVQPPSAGSGVVVTRLGDCDAFVSHSSEDNAGERYLALQHWVRNTYTDQYSPKLWIDHLCLDVGHLPRVDITSLPIFVAGSKQMVVLAGPSFSFRLWAVLEVFTFSQLRLSRERMVVLPLGGAAVTPLFKNFDVRKAKTRQPAAEHAIKAVIEATFGDMSEFNKVMCALCQ